MAGVMYHAYQKFYSALSNFERFSSVNDFFENVSSLDSFFSEYRSITFVLQASIPIEEEKRIYEKNRDLYLSDCKWFNDVRVQTIHKAPFNLVKKVTITEYSPSSGSTISEKNYTAEDDKSLNDIIDDLHKKWKERVDIEIFFSARFSFYEEGKSEDIFSKILAGISKMNTFMRIMYEEIGENCSLCEELDKKCSELIAKLSFVESRLIFDYIFYPHKDEFERASVMKIILADKCASENRLPISQFLTNKEFRGIGDRFDKFMFMNLCIGTTDLMPTIVCIYKNNTFSMDSFQPDIKTTFYRKYNEIAELVRLNEIIEVFIMMTYATVDFSMENMMRSANERSANSIIDFLVFAHINSEKHEECAFNGSDVIKPERWISIMKNGRNQELMLSKKNMTPIIDAFNIVK